jgi:hypothetical protein
VALQWHLYKDEPRRYEDWDSRSMCNQSKHTDEFSDFALTLPEESAAKNTNAVTSEHMNHSAQR